MLYVMLQEEFRSSFTNPMYLGDNAPLLPNGQLCLKSVTLWKDYHCRWGPQPSFESWNFFETRKHPPPFDWPSAERIQQIRRNRVLSLNSEGYNDTYVDRKEISQEINMTRRLCTEHGWPLIDVTRRSVEETAAEILTLFKEFKSGQEGGGETGRAG